MLEKICLHNCRGSDNDTLFMISEQGEMIGVNNDIIGHLIDYIYIYIYILAVIVVDYDGHKIKVHFIDSSDKFCFCWNNECL